MAITKKAGVDKMFKKHRERQERKKQKRNRFSVSYREGGKVAVYNFSFNNSNKWTFIANLINKAGEVTLTEYSIKQNSIKQKSVDLNSIFAMPLVRTFKVASAVTPESKKSELTDDELSIIAKRRMKERYKDFIEKSGMSLSEHVARMSEK